MSRDQQYAEVDVVHQLYQVATPRRGANYKALAKCGATANCHRSDGLPATMSGYNSRVTCSRCLSQSLDDSLGRWCSIFGEKTEVWYATRDAVGKARSDAYLVARGFAQAQYAETPFDIAIAYPDAQAQYAEALFDIAVAYPEELPVIYVELFPGDEDDIDNDDVSDPVVERVKELASKSTAAQDLTVELSGLATVPCHCFCYLAETLTDECRAGLRDHHLLCAVLDLIEICNEYENAITEAFEAQGACGPPSLTVIRGGLAPTAPRCTATGAHLQVVRTQTSRHRGIGDVDDRQLHDGAPDAW